MDFFEHQEQAKKASTRLLLLFLLVCFVVILCVDAVFYAVLKLGRPQGTHGQFSFDYFIQWQLSTEGLIVASISIFIISIGCIKRWFDLRKGGHGLAISIGARSLGFASKEDQEQQLINVVEEMSIAAGITTPGIYVLDHETSINAFVAGYEFEDSALIVTRGLLLNMNREELQAVVGHEISHILHGDNRINIRLMVLVAGFVWIAELGQMLTSHGRYNRGYGRRRSRIFGYGNNKSRQQAWALGLPLIIIGSFGTFLGRLIRTSISRKREYLADAASVQFTRNPESMASALNVIRENSHQGFLRNARADELSHMCITPTLKSTWFATHPPLENRINRIDDGFLKRYEVQQKKQERAEKKESAKKEQRQSTQSMYSAGISQLQQNGTAQLLEVIGTVTAASLDYAMSLHDELPYEYRQALHSVEKSKAMLFYLLFDKNIQVNVKQEKWIKEVQPDTAGYLQTLTLMAKELPPRLKLPLVELLIPVLKTMDKKAKTDLLAHALKLAKWDGKLSMFEICLYTLLKHSLAEVKPQASKHVIKKIGLVGYEMNVVVSCLVHMTGSNEQTKQELYQRNINILGLKKHTLLEKQAIKPKQVYSTLSKLKGLSPMLKRSLMDVCGDIVLDDGIVRGSEYETLRLMSLLLACPMPPLPMKSTG